MALESATFISQLVPANPPGSDLKSQGDDHLRMIKQVLQNCFPDASKAFYFTKGILKSANYSVVEADDNTLFSGDSSSGSFTFTLPAMSGLEAGWKVGFLNEDSSGNTVTVTPASGTIDGLSSIVLNFRDFCLIWLVGSSWHAEVVRKPRTVSTITQFTADQDNLDIGADDDFRISSTTPISITGIAGGYSGRVITFTNIDTSSITFTVNDVNSDAANRIDSSNNITLLTKASISFIYDGTLSLWRPLYFSPKITGRQTANFPAESWTPDPVTQPLFGIGQTTTNKVTRYSLNFTPAPAAEESAQIRIKSPESWDGGNLTARFTWSHEGGGSAFNAIWKIRGLALSDGDNLETAFGTEVSVTDTGAVIDGHYVSAETPEFTLGNSPSKGDTWIIRIARDALNVLDTLDVIAWLLEVEIFYNTDAATDD